VKAKRNTRPTAVRSEKPRSLPPLRVPIWLDDGPLDVYAFRVYCHFACVLHRPRAYALARIAAACNMSAARARQALQALVAAKLVRRTETPGCPAVLRLERVKRRSLIPDWFDRAGLDPTAFRVGAHMARRSEKSGLYFEGGRKAAKALGLAPRTVDRAFHRLRRRGMVADRLGGYQLQAPPECVKHVRGTPHAKDAPPLTPETHTPIVSDARTPPADDALRNQTGKQSRQAIKSEACADARATRSSTDPALRETEGARATTTTSWVREAAGDWNARFGAKAARHKVIGHELKPLIEAHGWPPVRQAWQRYLREQDGRYCSPANFREHYAMWSGGAKGMSERDRLFASLMAPAARSVAMADCSRCGRDSCEGDCSAR
jgi:hypothetical protein